jgi:hypothetical protein
MKDREGGIHQPGLHRAGEQGVTLDDFKALVARVSELEAAPPPTPGVSSADFAAFKALLRSNAEPDLRAGGVLTGAALVGLDGADVAGWNTPPDSLRDAFHSLEGLVQRVFYFAQTAAPTGSQGGPDADVLITRTGSGFGGIGALEASVFLDYQTADRTWTIDPTGFLSREIFRVLRTQGTVGNGFNLTIVNGGPGGGTLCTLGPDSARFAELLLNDAGTDFVLDRFGSLVSASAPGTAVSP